LTWRQKNEVPINPSHILLGLLCLQQAAISLNVAALSAVIPAISRDLAIPDLLVAKIIPYYMISYGIAALGYAPLARKVAVRTIMLGTMSLFAVTNFLCGVSDSIHLILFFRVLMGVFSAGVVPLGLILIGRIFEKGVRGRLVGLFFSCSFVASVSGIILSGVAHWRWQFFIPAGLGLLTAIFLFFTSSGDSLQRIEGRTDYGNVFRDAKMRNIFIFITLMSTLYHGVDRWLGVYMDRVYQLQQLTISLLFGLMAVSSACGQNIGGHLTDQKGRLVSCRVGILVLAVGVMLLSVKSNTALLAFILILLAVGWTIGHNGVSTVLTDFPDENRSEMASLNSSLRFLGGGLGFLVSGIFVEKSFALTFLGISILMFTLSLFLKKIIPETAKDAT